MDSRAWSPPTTSPPLEPRAVDTLSGSRPSGTSSPSRGGALRPVLVALLLAWVLTLPSAARELQISFSPDAPTWRDEIVVTVSGPGPHCTPELTEPVITFNAGWRIDLDLFDLCTIGPPSDGPFSVSTVIAPLTPLTATVRVHDQSDGGNVSTAELVVHRGADLELTVHEPVSSAEPMRITLEGVGACPEVAVNTPEPGVVRLDYSGNCAILPPGEFRFTFDVEAGPLPPGDYEVQAFDVSNGTSPSPPVVTTRAKVWDATRCVPSDEAHCLEEGRFRVEAQWKDFQAREGDARTLPTTLDDTGLFWFFTPDNVELTVKVLAACPVNGSFWVFVASGSTVEYEIEVTDTKTGARRTYHNDLGQIPELIADTSAFACP